MPAPYPAERAARNESVFRELNEQLDAAATGSSSDVSGFVCECANIACAAVVAVPLGDYQAVRQHPDRFIVAPDDSHVDLTVEEIVSREPEYWVVQKTGARRRPRGVLDPRE